VRDSELAAKFGITIPNQIVVMFHCGSRGFGHQVATDYLQTFLKVMGTEIRHQIGCALLAPRSSRRKARLFSPNEYGG